MEILEKEHFNTLKQLADTNVKVSEAKDVLERLKSMEVEYLESREKKVRDKVQKVLNESKDLLEETRKNYQSINTLCDTVVSYVDFIKEIQGKLENLQKERDKVNTLCEENITLQKKELSELRKTVDQDTRLLKEREEVLSQVSDRLQKEKALIESRQQALQTSYNAEKELWNQLQKKK